MLSFFTFILFYGFEHKIKPVRILAWWREGLLGLSLHLDEQVLATDACWKENQFSVGGGHWQVAHPSADDPTPMHMWTMLIRPSEL